MTHTECRLDREMLGLTRSCRVSPRVECALYVLSSGGMSGVESSSDDFFTF